MKQKEVGDLRYLQMKLLEIMEIVSNICEKENINYYILGGTFIGAVRHKGFIPWDDDIDIAMDRKEYEKFLKIIQDKLPKNLKLDYYRKNDTDVPWIKIKNTNYKVIEKKDNIEIEEYIFLDIFPFDNVPDNYVKRQVFRIQIFLESIKLRLARMRYISIKNNDNFNNKFKFFISKIINTKLFEKILNSNKYIKKYDKFGKKSKLGELGHNTIICSLKKFKEFILYKDLVRSNKEIKIIKLD